MVNVALVQMRCEKGDIASNLGAIERYIGAAVARGVDIVVFPEMSIAGYIDPTRMPEAVLTLDSPAVARFAALTRGGITALAGIVERNPDGKPFITQLVTRGGELVGRYRKRTIVDDEIEWFAPGDAPSVFHHGELCYGVAICADIGERAVFADCARLGARVIFECAAPGLYGEQATRDWQSGFDWWRGECMDKLGGYARELGIHIAVATQAGRTIDEDFPGGGYLFAPDGRCLHATPDWSEGVLYVTIPVGGSP